MTNRFLRCLISLSLVAASLTAQSRSEYAQWLYRQGDYFRAISEYKQLQFFTQDADSAGLFQFYIGKAYYRSGKHTNSIDAFAGVLERRIADSLKAQSFNYIALNYVNLSLPNQALYYNSEARKVDSVSSAFVAGLIYANLHAWDRSKEFFESAATSAAGGSVSRIARQNIDQLNRADAMEEKSPFLSMVLSAVLPGSGQYYAGHPVDALQAFAFVGSFAYMSSVAYRYDRQRGHGYYNFGISLSITSLFYAANIIGAERTASYHNTKQQQEFVSQINERSLPVYE